MASVTVKSKNFSQRQIRAIRSESKKAIKFLKIDRLVGPIQVAPFLWSENHPADAVAVTISPGRSRHWSIFLDASQSVEDLRLTTRHEICHIAIAILRSGSPSFPRKCKGKGRARTKAALDAVEEALCCAVEGEMDD